MHAAADTTDVINSHGVGRRVMRGGANSPIFMVYSSDGRPFLCFAPVSGANGRSFLCFGFPSQGNVCSFVDGGYRFVCAALTFLCGSCPSLRVRRV